jgi:CPA2 family monovalent cation:H+ antiporter-2
MHTPPILTDLVIILLVSVPVAYACLRLKLPVLVGFILTGILIGPYGLSLISELAAIELLAEIGVMLLLFTIGLEFSLKRLNEMRRLVLLGGGLQVLVTAAAAFAISQLFARDVKQSLFFGFLVALSSTAIVLKTFVDRQEVDSPHGRAGVGILLFQDISIVPMMLLIPVLGGGEASAEEIPQKIGVSFLALAGIVGAAWFLTPLFFKLVAKLRSPEMFLLTVVLILLGLSFLTAQFGLSLAIGAFIAGMVISESDYSHQISADIFPFRDVFNSLFFVSVGLLLSLPDLAANIGPVVFWVVAIVVGKMAIVLAVVKLLGFSYRIAAMAGLSLAQIGEFSFVLGRSGKQVGLFTGDDYQIFLASSVITMILTPFAIAAAPGFGMLVQRVFRDRIDFDPTTEEADIHLTSSGGLDQHVIIVGYGLNGRNLAKVLRGVGLPYTVLELDAEVVRAAKADGEKINYGDSTRAEILKHACVDRAYALVIAISDPVAARMTVKQVRALSPNVFIIVRTRYTSEISELLGLGANEVIPEEFETSIEIFARVLQRYGMGRHVIETQIDRIRRDRYEMLRTASHPEARIGNLNRALKSAETETFFVPPTSAAVGVTLGQLHLRSKTGTTIIAITRGEETEINPEVDFIIQAEDLLLLIGLPENLQKATELLGGITR